MAEICGQVKSCERYYSAVCGHAVLTVKPADYKGQHRAVCSERETMIGIYKITNKINGKFYIGQSVDIKRRFMEHKTPHGRMTSIKMAVRKYGKENFSFEVLEECSEADLNDREVYWIAKLKPQYNRCAGGTGARLHHVSGDARLILSRKNKEYWRRLPSEEKESIVQRLKGPAKGHAVSDETREKLRVANIGKRQDKETIEKRKETMRKKRAEGYVQTNEGHMKKIRCIETNQVFGSVKEAGEALSVHPSSISGVLKGRYKSCKGKHFEYVV